MHILHLLRCQARKRRSLTTIYTDELTSSVGDKPWAALLLVDLALSHNNSSLPLR